MGSIDSQLMYLIILVVVLVACFLAIFGALKLLKYKIMSPFKIAIFLFSCFSRTLCLTRLGFLIIYWDLISFDTFLHMHYAMYL